MGFFGALGDRIPRVAPLAIALLAILGLSIVRLSLLLGANTDQLVLNGYYDATTVIVLCLACGVGILVLALAVVVQVVTRRRILGYALLLFSSLVVGLWSLVSFSLGTRLPFSVVRANGRATYYALCDALVFSDTVYEIAETPSLWAPRWKRALDPQRLDYSEDGSLTADPHLILSKDEAILVVARGGHLTDAIDLETRTNLVNMIAWDEPGREQAWAVRTHRIEDILREHGGESR